MSSVNSIVDLGLMYQEGCGVRVNKEKACELLKLDFWDSVIQKELELQWNSFSLLLSEVMPFSMSKFGWQQEKGIDVEVNKQQRKEI